MKKWTEQFPDRQTPETVQERIDALIRERNNRPNITLQQYQTLNTQLSLWTKTFPNETASQVQVRINNLNSLVSRYSNAETKLYKAEEELAKEKGWWVKWLVDLRNKNKPFFADWGLFFPPHYQCPKDYALFYGEGTTQHYWPYEKDDVAKSKMLGCWIYTHIYPHYRDE